MSTDLVKREIGKIICLLFKNQECCPFVLIALLSFICSLISYFLGTNFSVFENSLVGYYTSILAFGITGMAIILSLLPHILDRVFEENKKNAYYHVSSTLALTIPINVLGLVLLQCESVFNLTCTIFHAINIFCFIFSILWILHCSLHIFSLSIPEKENNKDNQQ